MKVNGIEKNLESPILIQDYIKKEHYNTDRIAIELNGEIIPKTKYASIFLTEADILEIVSFVGGG